MGWLLQMDSAGRGTQYACLSGRTPSALSHTVVVAVTVAAVGE